MGANGHFIFRGTTLATTEWETGWASDMLGTIWKEEGPLPEPGFQPQAPGCPALVPITTPGPVHAVSSHVCAPVYYIVLQTRLKYSEQERWVMMEMKYWKAVSGGFRTGTAIPELGTAIPFIYRLLEAQDILCHSQPQHYLICINSRRCSHGRRH